MRNTTDHLPHRLKSIAPLEPIFELTDSRHVMDQD